MAPHFLLGPSLGNSLPFLGKSWKPPFRENFVQNFENSICKILQSLLRWLWIISQCVFNHHAPSYKWVFFDRSIGSVAAEGYQVILNWLWFIHNHWKYICKWKFNISIRFFNLSTKYDFTFNKGFFNIL